MILKPLLSNNPNLSQGNPKLLEALSLSKFGIRFKKSIPTRAFVMFVIISIRCTLYFLLLENLAKETYL